MGGDLQQPLPEPHDAGRLGLSFDGPSKLVSSFEGGRHRGSTSALTHQLSNIPGRATVVKEMMVHLTVIEEGQEERKWRHEQGTRKLILTPENPVVPIGRSSKTSIKGFNAKSSNAYFDSAVMSRDHATLEADFSPPHAKLWLRDNRSLHGTYLRSIAEPQREVKLLGMERRQIQSGDKITFGIAIYRTKQAFPPLCVSVKVREEHAKPLAKPELGEPSQTSKPSEGETRSRGYTMYDPVAVDDSPSELSDHDDEEEETSPGAARLKVHQPSPPHFTYPSQAVSNQGSKNPTTGSRAASCLDIIDLTSEMTHELHTKEPIGSATRPTISTHDHVLGDTVQAPSGPCPPSPSPPSLRPSDASGIPDPSYDDRDGYTDAASPFAASWDDEDSDVLSDSHSDEDSDSDRSSFDLHDEDGADDSEFPEQFRHCADLEMSPLDDETDAEDEVSQADLVDDNDATRDCHADHSPRLNEGDLTTSEAPLDQAPSTSSPTDHRGDQTSSYGSATRDEHSQPTGHAVEISHVGDPNDGFRSPRQPSPSDAAMAKPLLRAAYKAQVEALGLVSGKPEFFVAREENRARFKTPPVSALRETLLPGSTRSDPNNDSDRSASLHDDLWVSRVAWPTFDGGPGDSTSRVPVNESPAQDESAGKRIESTEVPTCVPRDLQCSPKSPLSGQEPDMTSAHQYEKSKKARLSTPDSNRDRVKIRNLVSQTPAEPSIQPDELREGSGAKRSFGQAFDGDDEASDTRCPAAEKQEAAPRELAEAVQVPLASQSLTRSSAPYAPNKRRRVAEAAAFMVLGGASLFSALVLSAPSFT